MTLCPVCRYKDSSSKVRLLNGQPFFSCKSCFEREERRQPKRPPERDPLSQMGYPVLETITPR
jgi:hypothetical protein